MENVAIHRKRFFQAKDARCILERNDSSLLVIKDHENFILYPPAPAEAKGTALNVVFAEALSPRDTDGPSNIICAHRHPLDDTVLLAYSTGEILLYTAEDEQSYSGEVVGCFPAGLQAAQVSPDDEFLALLTGDGQIILMSRSGLFPTSEGSLSEMAHAWTSQSVSVGWGRKETQFHGKAGKQAALAKIQVEERLTEYDDRLGRISWRNDGAYLAISFVVTHDHRNGDDTSRAEPRRQIVIMDREGRVVAVNEPREGLGQALAWRPDGLLAASQSLPQGGPHRVIFFEPNGLGHGEFSLSSGDGPIVELAWNADGTILSMILTGGRALLWTMENYHWYLKYSLPGKCSQLHWSRSTCQPQSQQSPSFPRHAASLLLHYLTSWGGIVEYQFMFRIDRSSCMGDDELCLVATIDGSKVLLTPFARANVPPPMAFAQVELDGPVNCVAVYCAADGTRMAVATPGGHVSIFLLGMREGSMESALLSNFATHHSNLKQIIFQDVETLFCLPDDGLQLELPGGGGSRRVEAYCTRMGRLLYSDISGAVYVDDHTVLLHPSQGTAVWDDFFIANDQLHYVSLDHDNRLFVDDELIATDCTSFVIHPEFFCLTTPTGLLRFYPLSRPVSQWASIMAATGGAEEEFSRLSEGGAKCVVVVPKAAALVLKMPRGNLETVYPRAFVLSQTRRLLNGLSYREALLLCRRHRVDLNILHDNNPELFMRTLQKFIQQIPEVDYLNLFLSNLKAENVAATRYGAFGSYLVGGTAGGEGGVKEEGVPREYPDKVNKVCQAFLDHLLDQGSSANDSAKYAETIMTAHVCQNPPQVEQALRRIIDLAGHQEASFMERAIKYLCFLVPAERLYRVTLGLYNLPLALTIARRSSMDPAEYTAFLEELHSMDNLRERHFRIDDFLQRLAPALENLIDSGAPFERCLEYTARHQLYPVAFRLYADRCRVGEWRQLCDHYGSQLIQQGGDAAAVVDLLQFAGTQDEAIAEVAVRAGLWERVVQLVSPGAPAFGPISKRLVEALRGQGRLGDATMFAELYLEAAEALSLAIEGQLWSTGARICHRRGLSKEQLVTAALRQASAVGEELAQLMLDFGVKSARLELLQQKLVEELDPARIMAALEASGGDTITGTGDRVVSEMSFRTGTTTFGGSQISQLSRATTSKSKRKAERQRTRGKPGSPFEREFLRDAIWEIIRRLGEQRRASIDLVQFLAREERFGEARTLQRTLIECGTGVRNWCDRLRRLISVQEEKMGPEVLAALGMTAFTIPPALQITHEWRTAFETDPALGVPILPYLAD